MFDFGPEKILVVLVFAFVFVGPKRLPEIAKQIGSGLRTLRGLENEVRTQITSAVDVHHEPRPPAALNTDRRLPADHGRVDDHDPPRADINSGDPATGASFA